jgi:phage terminase large subunit
MTSAHLSVIPEFKEKIAYINRQPDFHELKTEIVNKCSGSSVVFKGIKTGSGDQTANLKSLQGMTTWIMDEGEELQDENTFDKIDLSIRQKGVQNRVIILLNPSTKAHWIYKRFFEDRGIKEGFTGQAGDTTYIHTTYLDNYDNLDESFIKKVEWLRDNNPIKYNHVILGGWLNAAEGVIFSNWEYGDFDLSLPFGYGMDFGFFPDPDFITKVAIDSKRMLIYVKSELKLNNAGVDLLSKTALSVVDKSKIIIADCSENRLITDLYTRGLTGITAVKKGTGSVLSGIKIMQDYKIIVHPDSTEIGTELNNYVWSDKKNGVPIDAYNHFIDSIRYYVQTVIKANVNRPMRLA